MAKKQNDDHESQPVPYEAIPEKRLQPATKEVPPPQETRVLLTGDNRSVVTEAYVPTQPDMFRIYIEGMGHFEHVADAVDSGTWIYAPTR